MRTRPTALDAAVDHPRGAQSDARGPGTGRSGSLTANVMTVADALRDPRLRIPEYQRPYTWSTTNTGQLVEDIRRFRSAASYRIGTMIVHAEDGWLDIVDGQQRYMTFALIALALQEVLGDTAERAEHQRAALDRAAAIELPPGRRDVSERHIVENYRLILQTFRSWDSTEVEDFADYFLDRCTLVRLIVSDLDAAFQMFDSQNTRGRALLPTDLLKAYHLRAYGEATSDRAAILAAVREWEATPPFEIHHLFSRLLYPILRWSAGESLPRDGFTASRIGAFKGISAGPTGLGRLPWAHGLLMAKAHVDDYNTRNAALIAHGALAPLEFPFQLSQPIIDGEMFFRFVRHYTSLARTLGVSATEADQTVQDDARRHREIRRVHAITGLVRSSGNGAGYRYTQELYGALLLAYADRFGAEDLERAALVLARHAFALRTRLRRVYPRSTELHALGLNKAVDSAEQVNLFRLMMGTMDPAAITGRVAALPGPYVDEASPVERLYSDTPWDTEEAHDAD